METRSRRILKPVLVVVATLGLVVSYQNCSTPFSSSSGSSTGTALSAADPYPDLPNPAVPQVADSADVPLATGTAYYFSDCQSGAAAGCTPGANSNAGTSMSAPKQNLTGFNFNALPAGSQILFKRGGAWNQATIRLNNPNVTPTNPLFFGAYGTGSAPILNATSDTAPGIETGEFAPGPTFPAYGGYVLRDLKLQGPRTGGSFGIWLRGGVQYVYIERMEITGFYIGLNAQGGNDANHIFIRNSVIARNHGMGTLGTYRDTLFEGNIYWANNFSGSSFNHAIYLSSGSNITIRNNDLLRNSVVNGICQGGNLTAHGLINGLLIENNRLTQDNGGDGCFGISLNPGYADRAEGFQNLIVRQNTLTNVGSNSISISAAPNALIEQNRIKHAIQRSHYGITIGTTDPGPDLAGGGEIVRNNEFCLRSGHVAVTIMTSGTQSNNTVHTTCPF